MAEDSFAEPGNSRHCGLTSEIERETERQRVISDLSLKLIMPLFPVGFEELEFFLIHTKADLSYSRSLDRDVQV